MKSFSQCRDMLSLSMSTAPPNWTVSYLTMKMRATSLKVAHQQDSQHGLWVTESVGEMYEGTFE